VAFFLSLSFALNEGNGKKDTRKKAVVFVENWVKGIFIVAGIGLIIWFIPIVPETLLLVFLYATGIAWSFLLGTSSFWWGTVLIWGILITSSIIAVLDMKRSNFFQSIANWTGDIPGYLPCPECNSELRIHERWTCDYCKQEQTKERLITDRCEHCDKKLKKVYCEHCHQRLEL